MTRSWTYAADDRLTFDVLRMTWVSMKGRRCFGGRFLAMACIVTMIKVKTTLFPPLMIIDIRIGGSLERGAETVND